MKLPFSAQLYFQVFRLWGQHEEVGARKKSEGVGVGSESGMTFTGLPQLSLSPSLFYSAL